MALTTEQQAQIELQTAMDAPRLEAEAKSTLRHHRLEAVRIAQMTLVENKRTAPADASAIEASDIVGYADVLMAYINA
jgi:hypothetical protein